MSVLPLGPQHLGGDDDSGGREVKKSGLTRRQILVRAVTATGGLLISSVLVRFAALLRHNPASGRRALSAREETILIAVLGALFPQGGEMPSADPAFLIPQIDSFLAATDLDARVLFRAMLHVVEDQAIVFQHARFSRCSPRAQASEIRAWELTPIYTKRMAFQSVKVVAGLSYFEQPGVRESIGWYVGCSPEQLEPATKDSLGAAARIPLLKGS